MRIGLDFDGVIADSLALKCQAAKELYGVDFPPAKFKKEIVVDGGFLTLEQYRSLQVLVYGSRDVGMRMLPVTGVQQAVRALRECGHDLHVVTSRDGVMLDVAREWAAQNGLALTFTGVGHQVSKAEATAGMDVFVDDDLDKLEPLVGVVPHRFLFSWEYNTHLNEADVAVRMRSWEDILSAVNALAAAKEEARA